MRPLRFNLATLLLGMAVSGCAIAYIMSRARRIQLTEKMNAVLVGSSPVRNVAICSTDLSYSRNGELMIWVPNQNQLKLCWATERIGARFPQEHDSLMLGEGRHIVLVRNLLGETLVQVDKKRVFSRKHSKTWNLDQNASWRQTGYESVKRGRTLLFTGYGVATLAADEPYDVDRHQFGLLLWVDR